MATHARPGVVIFTANVPRLTTFYKALTGLPLRHADADHTVLASESFELVIHALRHEPAAAEPPAPRWDVYLKPFFPVASLAAARERAGPLGGRLHPPAEEWEGRGFRACEGVDPDGNVIQFRVNAG